MRVGLIRQKYDSAGGAEKTLLLLAEGLLARGHEVHVVAVDWQGPRPEGLKLHLVELEHHSGRAAMLEWALTARARMIQTGVETFLSLERVPGSPVVRAGDGCHAAWLARRGRFCSALKRASFRFNPKHRAFLELERRTFASAALELVIANSRMVADELGQYCGVAKSKITVIYNGVDEARLAAARLAATRDRARDELALTRPTLLFLGSGFQRKGLAFAIEALALLPEAELLVVGKDRVGAFKRQAGRLGLERRVRFMGQRKDVDMLLAGADAMVLPTIYDPCANACLEALWAGLPVVTTTANGAAELIDPGLGGGIVQRPDDARALAEACRRALGLERGFAARVPSQDQWLSQTIAALEGRAERILP
ncbi:glycosyltransferase family 4 protein [Desulfarculus baarsii]